MARGKKKEATFSLEERLESALVPIGAQPYKVPENWRWINLGSVISDSKERTNDFFNTNIKYIGLEHMEKDVGIVEAGSADEVKSQKSIFHPGQVLYGRLRPYLNKHDVATFEGICSTDILVFNIAENISPKLINYYFNTTQFIDYAVANSKGINLPRVSAETVHSASFPLPPLAEQQRIVDRFESLFSKLDEVKEKAQEALDSFQDRRMAILDKAFRGSLTRDWRIQHNVEASSWQTEQLSNVSSLQTGLMKGKRFEGTTVTMPYLRVANVQDGFLDLSEIKEIEIGVESIERYSLRYGDVLFTEGGDFDKLGRGTVWENQIDPCLHQNHIFVVRPDPDVLNPYFLSYQAGSQYGKKYFMSCAKQTTNLASINSTQLKNFPVLIPTLDEQLEIVRLLDNFFEKEAQAKAQVEATLNAIELMKKSILSKAFRGELGTNDPREESAIELLKTIV